MDQLAEQLTTIRDSLQRLLRAYHPHVTESIEQDGNTNPIEELGSLLARVQARCYSTYHTCAAIAEIAGAALARDYPANPYLVSIEQLAMKEDEQGGVIVDILATCEQILNELLDSSIEIAPQGEPICDALRRAIGWIDVALSHARHVAPSAVPLTLVEMQL